ncbi:hypothetical protein BLAT2472_50083 [Burkholderia latens]
MIVQLCIHIKSLSEFGRSVFEVSSAGAAP